MMNRYFLLSTITGLCLCAFTVNAFETTAKNAFLIDANTGYVMLNKDGDVPMPPASMSKLMTAYMIFDQLKEGKITLDTEFTVSENAWRKGGAASGSSTMFLKPNQKVKVRDLLRGIIVQSGNDACIVAAENLSGTEDVFAALMTAQAKKLGLKNATFRNSTGLPDPDHKMSARDLALLAQALIRDFPEYYPIYSEKTFTYNGIKQGNRNPLLYDVVGADGLKTGHTNVSGYGLTGSVKTQDGRRLIMVINGLKSMKERSQESKRIMSWGLASFENVEPFKNGQKIEDIPVWLGEQKTVAAIVPETVVVTIPRGQENIIEAKINYESPLIAPILKGQKVGTLTVKTDEQQVKTVDLVASDSVEKVGYFGKLKAVVLSWFGK